jgi:hypothetical protein
VLGHIGVDGVHERGKSSEIAAFAPCWIPSISRSLRPAQRPSRYRLRPTPTSRCARRRSNWAAECEHVSVERSWRPRARRGRSCATNGCPQPARPPGFQARPKHGMVVARIRGAGAVSSCLNRWCPLHGPIPCSAAIQSPAMPFFSVRSGVRSLACVRNQRTLNPPRLLARARATSRRRRHHFDGTSCRVPLIIIKAVGPPQWHAR